MSLGIEMSNKITPSNVRKNKVDKAIKHAYDIFAKGNRDRYAKELEKHKAHQSLMSQHAERKANKAS